jgi:serine phosphatase RsbU (regulator of sigma subunit)
VFDGLDVRTLYRPINAVGGDVFSAERLADGALAISLADVSGHGVAAGMLTPLLRRTLSVHSTSGNPSVPLSADEVLRRANRELLALDLSDGLFATALHVRFEASARKLTFARAGHCHPILLREGETPRLLPSEGTLLGAFDGLTFPMTEVTLRPGDRVVLYTDGLEALVADGETNPYPTQLSQTAWFAQLGGLSADEVITDVERRRERAAWRSADADDVTLIVITACT